ncbi:Alpha/Beta hydrolase protein [Staphylotrichum tortipilum]|uniref:Alpha/Beta hydrolase protein n=1 Tax=Staphylotrichum tortipilum TaxID=2831512 RepID=A0AAN6MDS7_9PEZI|nr:Alpha/Beta hydrolase protein [Staphylotrichum longicolle]
MSLNSIPAVAEASFGEVHTIEPSSAHTHTAIMLHGRGSDGPEFAQELAETVAPGQTPLVERFPGWRWVFPSSQELWSTAFEETLPAWFEAHSLTDPTTREELQMGGIRQSVAYLQGIIAQEVARLGGDHGKVVMLGISQGGAIGMLTLLCQEGLGRPLGAFVGASTWLPFAANIGRHLGKVEGGQDSSKPSDVFVRDMMPAWNRSAVTSTPILLGHGVDDPVVDVELGRQARETLAGVDLEADTTHNPLATPMDAFEATKPDRFHQSLSNSWASFLSAHHFGREVAALRKALDEHSQQTRLAIASLEKAAADRHAPLAAAVTESKSTIEQHAAELKGINSLRASFSAHQQDASQHNDDASRKITELSEKLVAQQESLERALALTSREISAVQEQHRLALETVDRLRVELSEARADKIASAEKLAAIEDRVNAMSQPSPVISEHAAGFLEEMLSRREELIKLLDTPHCPDDAANIRTLYQLFRDRYRAGPPRSDTAFIWEFIGSIEPPAMSRHIQESLADILPEHVTRCRDTRRRDPRRHVTISKGLTWRRFREALVRIPGPG